MVKALISEEKEGLLELNENGVYTVCYDPLDCSSLADVNLSVGSIFGIYKGKLRQLFEVIPFAFMYEQAGGEAVDNSGKILMELVPSFPHDTSPCFFGSKYEVNKLKDVYGANA